MLGSNRNNKNMVFKSNEIINSILNYPEPSFLSVVEIIYNNDVLDILSSLDYNQPNYNKIYDALYPDNINGLKQLKKHSSRGRHNCSYKKTICGKGRYYLNNPKKNDFASLQNCYGRVRRLIVDGKLTAIDLTNAHLEIIKNLAFFLEIPKDKYDILNFYCDNRKQVLNEIMNVFNCDREVAKNYFIIILFGGSYDTWITHNNLLDKNDLKTDFMKSFESAFDIIKQEFNNLDVFNGFKVVEKQVNKKKDFKIEKTALAIFLQEIESKILVVMVQYLEGKGCIIRIPIHDGVWFDDVKGICNDDFLIELSNEIYQKLNLKIPLDYEDTSPTKEDLEWFSNHKNFYETYNSFKHIDKVIIDGSNDDEGASKAVINKYKDFIIRCDKNIIVKENNYWSYEKDDVDRVLSRFVVNTNIYFYGANEKLYSYSNSVSHQNKCVSSIRKSDFIKVDNNFIINLSMNNKGYLPFLNGIWSMKEKKIYKYEELPDIHFFSIINHNLETQINKDKFNEFLEKVIIPIFPDEAQRDYFSHITCRSIAGHNEDKKWFGISGARNSGKGVLTDCMTLAFDKYFGTFNAKSLINNKYGNQEPERALGWVISHIITRSLWCNEIDADTTIDNKTNKTKDSLNGNFIKSLASGGDVMSGREIYEKKISFKPSFTMFLLFNEMPNVEPVDALENYLEFSFKSKFVYSNELIEDYPNYKLRDDNIKNYIKEEDSINSFRWWILNSYDNVKDVPESVKNTNNSINKDCVKITVDNFILEHFKNSKSNSDRISVNKLKNILEEVGGFYLTSQMLNRTMARLEIGSYNKDIKIDGDRAGYTNIIYKLE